MKKTTKKWYYFWGSYAIPFCLYLAIITGYMIFESIRIFRAGPSLDRLLAMGYIIYGIPISIVYLFIYISSVVKFFSQKETAWFLITIPSVIYIIFAFSKYPFAWLLDNILNLGGGVGGIFLYLDTIYLLPLVVIGCYKIFKFIKDYEIKT